MKKDDRIYFEHILACIRDVRRYASQGRQAFCDNDMVQNACLRQLQVMAESTTRLSQGSKSCAPEIDWGSMAGFRNILVHQYLGDIDLDKVWKVIEKDLVPLEKALRKLHQGTGQ